MIRCDEGHAPKAGQQEGGGRSPAANTAPHRKGARPPRARRCAWCGEPFEPRMARQRFCGVRCRRDWDNMRGQAERELARLEREAEAEEERLRDAARDRIHAGRFSELGLFSTDDPYGWNAGTESETNESGGVSGGAGRGRESGHGATSDSRTSSGATSSDGRGKGRTSRAGNATERGDLGESDGVSDEASGAEGVSGGGESGGWPWPLWTRDPWSVDEADTPGTEGITANALVDAVPW